GRGPGGDPDAAFGLGTGADEVLVEVLLAGQDGAPRRGAAGAVVQGAEHLGPGGIVGGLQQRGAGGRPVHGERRGAGDAAVAAPAAHVLPRLALAAAPEVHDGQAVGLDGGLDDVLRVGLQVLRGEHDVLVGVLMAVHQVARAVVAAVRDDV